MLNKALLYEPDKHDEQTNKELDARRNRKKKLSGLVTKMLNECNINANDYRTKHLSRLVLQMLNDCKLVANSYRSDRKKKLRKLALQMLNESAKRMHMRNSNMKRNGTFTQVHAEPSLIVARRAPLLS